MQKSYTYTNKIYLFGKRLKIGQIVAVKLAQHKNKRITIRHTLWLQNKKQIFSFTQPRQPQVCVSSRHNSSFKIALEEIQLLANQCLMFTNIL